MKNIFSFRRPFTTLFAALAGVLPLSDACGQGDDTGGTGTIDPNSVALHEVINDASIIRDSHETAVAQFLASDAAGNIYTAATATRSDTVFPVSHTIISKYTPAGTLLWQRERMVDVSYDTGYEKFSPDQTPVKLTGDDAGSTVQVAALEVDAAGNVAVGFDTLNIKPDPNTGQNRRYFSPRTLIVRFDTDGRFLWRRALGVETLTTQYLPYYGVGEINALTTLRMTPDGGVAVLINNRSPARGSTVDRNATVFVRLAAADGAVKSVGTYGTFADNTNAFPIVLTLDGSANAYVLSKETVSTDSAGSDPSARNVIRKFGPAGNLLGRSDSPYFDPSNGQATEDWKDARADDDGNLYVCGDFRRNRTNASSRDGQAGQLLRAYTPDLTLRWRTLGPQPTQTAEEQPIVSVRAMRLSPGGITVAGQTRSDALSAANGDEHWEITRYAYADGGVRWHRLYQGQAVPNISRGDSVGALQVDAQDNVYGVGSRSAAPRNQQVLIKYSAVGDTQFVKVLPDFDIGNATFQLLAGNRPAVISGVPLLAGKSVVVETVDNPAVVPVAGSAHPAFFNGEVALGQGVYYLAFPGNGNIFGYYQYLSDPKFVYHYDLGFEYVFDLGNGGVVFYDFKSNDYFYTSPSFGFPYLYDFGLNAFLYYYPDPTNPQRYNTNGVRYFFNFSTGTIISQ